MAISKRSVLTGGIYVLACWLGSATSGRTQTPLPYRPAPKAQPQPAVRPAPTPPRTTPMVTPTPAPTTNVAPNTNSVPSVAPYLGLPYNPYGYQPGLVPNALLSPYNANPYNFAPNAVTMPYTNPLGINLNPLLTQFNQPATPYTNPLGINLNPLLTPNVNQLGMNLNPLLTYNPWLTSTYWNTVLPGLQNNYLRVFSPFLNPLGIVGN